jgi:hypothetical protein
LKYRHSAHNRNGSERKRLVSTVTLGIWSKLDVVQRRSAELFIVLAASALSAQTATVVSPLDLQLEQRLDLPQRVASASLRLTDFASFVATTYKVPLLVETPASVPDLNTPAGTYTARQLLDAALDKLPGFQWKDEDGVAHIYQTRLVTSSGNLLNVRIPEFSVPEDVGEFMYYFRPCINSVIQGYGCRGGIYTGFQLPKLQQGRLPPGQNFREALAREILLAALKTNGRFYVLIAFEGTEPKLKSQFPFGNWFAESLEMAEPSPLWVQTHQKHPVDDCRNNRHHSNCALAVPLTRQSRGF